MLGDDPVKGLHIFKCPAHDGSIVNTLSIIAEHPNLRRRRRHCTEFGQLLPAQTYRHRSYWKNIHQAGCFPEMPHLLDNTRGVGNR